VSAKNEHSWEAMASGFRIGRKIIVTPKMGSGSLTGRLRSISDHSITVQEKNGDITISRTNVLSVRQARIGHPALYGALAGAVFGGFFLWITEIGSGHPQYAEAFGMGSFFGAPVGAIIGALCPAIFQPLLRGGVIFSAADRFRD